MENHSRNERESQPCRFWDRRCRPTRSGCPSQSGRSDRRWRSTSTFASRASSSRSLPSPHTDTWIIRTMLLPRTSTFASRASSRSRPSPHAAHKYILKTLLLQRTSTCDSHASSSRSLASPHTDTYQRTKDPATTTHNFMQTIYSLGILSFPHTDTQYVYYGHCYHFTQTQTILWTLLLLQA